MEIARKRSCKFDSLHSGRHGGAQQATKWRRALEVLESCLRRRTIAVNVLPDQVNLTVAVIAQLFDLFDDFGGSATLLSPARIRDDAIRAKLIAPFDDGHEGNIPGSAGGRRNVPPLILGTFAEIDHTLLVIKRARDQIRETIGGPGSRNQSY